MIDVQNETPRARRRRARTEAILDASMKVVLEEGAHALTMRRLATALDLTPGAVYRYFDGKDVILAALGHRTLGRLAAALDDGEEIARRRARGAPDEVAALSLLLARAWNYWEFSLREPGAWRLINLLLVEPRRLIEGEKHARFMAAVSVQIQRTAALTDAAVAAGALAPGPGPERALVIVAALNGSLQLTKMAETSPLPFVPAQTLRLALDTLLRGWSAHPAAMEQAWALLEPPGS